MFCDGIADQIAQRGYPELEHASGSISLKGRAAAIEKHLDHRLPILVPKFRRVGSEKPSVEALRDSDDAF